MDSPAGWLLLLWQLAYIGQCEKDRLHKQSSDSQLPMLVVYTNMSVSNGSKCAMHIFFTTLFSMLRYIWPDSNNQNTRNIFGFILVCCMFIISVVTLGLGWKSYDHTLFKGRDGWVTASIILDTLLLGYDVASFFWPLTVLLCYSGQRRARPELNTLQRNDSEVRFGQRQHDVARIERVGSYYANARHVQLLDPDTNDFYYKPGQMLREREWPFGLEPRVAEEV